MRFRIVAATLVLACSAADAQAAPKPRLKAFASCRQLVNFARDGAQRTAGGVGVVGRAPAGPIDAVTTPPAPTKAPTNAPAAAPAPTSATPDFSGTNVQELGVDEPDVVKTDGRLIYAITDGKLRIVDVTGATPIVRGTLALDGTNQRMLLRGTRVLVIASKFAPTPDVPRPVEPVAEPVPAVGLAGGPPATVVTEIDASDPAAPKVARTMEVPGAFVDARQHGQTARLVVDSVPAPIQPDAVPQARLSRFLGHTTLHSRLSGRTFRRDLAPCGAVRRPALFSGLDVLAILTIDLDRGMYSLDRDGVMASAQVVYGSPDSLYVASRRYIRAVELGTSVPDDLRTEIHRFDISDPEHSVYRASGSVPGFILNSYAMSEYQGDLRVATTEEPPWQPGAPSTTKSTVTVLRQQGATLAPVGAVTGIGQGERIYAVRFLGDRGYVVTFRQVDPLFVLDLADPAAPKVTGELQIPGYSAYLHPITDRLLLGIGRDGSSVKASLFDVSDPAAPKLDSQVNLGGGYSQLETEPHAFLYWAPASLAVFPFGDFSSFTGAVGLHAGAGAPLSEAGRIVHHSDAGGVDAPIDRALVIGDKLFTLSYLGVGEARLDTLASTGFTAF